MIADIQDDNDPDWAAIGIWVMLALFAVLCLFSCNTVKQDTRRLNAINERHPALVAEKLAQWFPPKQDTIIKGVPVIKQVRWEDVTKISRAQARFDSLLQIKLFQDKIFALEPNIQKVIDSVKDETIRDMGTFETDSVYTTDTIRLIPSNILAAMASLHNDIATLHDAGIKSNTQLQDTQATLSKSRIWNIILLALLIGYIGFRIAKLYYAPKI